MAAEEATLKATGKKKQLKPVPKLSETAPRDPGCNQVRQMRGKGLIGIQQLGIAENAVAGVVYVWTVEAGSESPCEMLRHAHCFLIAQNVPDNGGGPVDVYIVHCPYGPPCTFM